MLSELIVIYSRNSDELQLLLDQRRCFLRYAIHFLIIKDMTISNIISSSFINIVKEKASKTFLSFL